MSQGAADLCSASSINAKYTSFHRLNTAYVELHLLLLAFGKEVSRGTGWLMTGYGGNTRFH